MWVSSKPPTSLKVDRGVGVAQSCILYFHRPFVGKTGTLDAKEWPAQPFVLFEQPGMLWAASGYTLWAAVQRNLEDLPTSRKDQISLVVAPFELWTGKPFRCNRISWARKVWSGVRTTVRPCIWQGNSAAAAYFTNSHGFGSGASRMDEGIRIAGSGHVSRALSMYLLGWCKHHLSFW